MMGFGGGFGGGVNPGFGSGAVQFLPSGCMLRCPGSSGGFPGGNFPGGNFPGGGFPGFPGYPGFPGFPGAPCGSCPPGCCPNKFPPGWPCCDDESKRRRNRCVPPPFVNTECENGCLADGPGCPKCPWIDCCAVYGGMKISDSQNIVIPLCAQGVSLGLNSTLPSKDITFNGNNTLLIQCSGTYELTFFGNFKSTNYDANLTFFVRANGTRLPETVVNLDIRANTDYSFERTVLVHLCANTTLAAVVDHNGRNHTVAAGASNPDCSDENAPIAPATPASNPLLLRVPSNGIHLEVIRVGSY